MSLRVYKRFSSGEVRHFMVYEGTRQGNEIDKLAGPESSCKINKFDVEEEEEKRSETELSKVGRRRIRKIRKQS